MQQLNLCDSLPPDLLDLEKDAITYSVHQTPDLDWRMEYCSKMEGTYDCQTNVYFQTLIWRPAINF